MLGAHGVFKRAHPGLDPGRVPVHVMKNASIRQRLPPCSGVAHVFGVCSLAILLKKFPIADPAALPDNAVWIDLLNPTLEEDRAGRAAGRDRGADPGRHAGDRDFQPALYRERRAAT